MQTQKTTTTPSAYGLRLDLAMDEARISMQQLADGIGTTYHAINNVLKGRSASFNAANNALASRFLNVDPDWLALGEGDMYPAQGEWPFANLSQNDYGKLNVEEKAVIEGVARNMALEFVKQRNSSSFTSIKMPDYTASWSIPITQYKPQNAPVQRSFFEGRKNHG